MDFSRILLQQDWICPHCSLSLKYTLGTPQADARITSHRNSCHRASPRHIPSSHHTPSPTPSYRYDPPTPSESWRTSSTYTPGTSPSPDHESPVRSHPSARTHAHDATNAQSASKQRRRERHAADQLRRMAAHRRVELEEDPHTAVVTVDTVTCKRCERSVSLPGPYHTNPWLKHKRYCSKIRAYEERHGGVLY